MICFLHISMHVANRFRKLRIQWRLLTILKKSKKVYEGKSIQYTIHWDKTQMLKKFLLDKINVARNALFFLSWAATHRSFTFIIYDSCMSWGTKFVSLNLCVGFPIFDSVFFLLKPILLFNKMQGLFDFKTS